MALAAVSCVGSSDCLAHSRTTGARRKAVDGSNRETSRSRRCAAPSAATGTCIWRTDSPVAALGQPGAGPSWGWRSRSFVRLQLAFGTLRGVPLANLANALDLWVYMVWSKERLLGLGAAGSCS